MYTSITKLGDKEIVVEVRILMEELLMRNDKNQRLLSVNAPIGTVVGEEEELPHLLDQELEEELEDEE